MTKNNKQLVLHVVKGKVLGVNVYRGYARLCDLALISKPDIYDQKSNPKGTQRDLSPAHAREAYEYVKSKKLAFWPEVFLNLRSKDVSSFKTNAGSKNCGELVINFEKIAESKKILISRIDGNHRLHYADGKEKGYEPIEREVSFCLAENLTLEEEITLFQDINDNQKRMNTSHLDNIKTRLTAEDALKIEDPELYISKKLGTDKDSPFYNIIYQGGKKPQYFTIPLRTLKSGMKYMFSSAKKLQSFDNVDVQYKIIRNYFNALKKWQPYAWKDPKKYLLLRGAVLWSACLIGAEVIDRCLAKSKYKVEDMLKILKSGRIWNWANKGDFKGYSGRGGATQIYKSVINEFKDEKGVSAKDLFKKILND